MGLYKDFVESAVWLDLKEIFSERLRFNRDQLEGIHGRGEEDDEKIRGRCAELRDLQTMIEALAEAEEEESSEEGTRCH